MSAKQNELPRDLRALCGGVVEDADGSQRTLLFPADAYANVCEVRKELERAIADPETPIEDAASLHDELAFVKREEADMERRILDHFKPRTPRSKPTDKDPSPVKVDHGAKSKMEKVIADVQSGSYNRKRTATLRAVHKAIAYFRENGRMPSHDELMKLGFNDQQATDAGKWLAEQNRPHPHPLFMPLHKPKRGRPKK